MYVFKPLYAIRRTGGGRGLRGGGQGKDKSGWGVSWMTPELSASTPNQWTTTAQDEGEWRKAAEQGAEPFMTKWMAAAKAKAGLQHAIVCPNVTGGTKDRLAQSKRVRAGSHAIVDSPQVARACILR